MKVNTKVTFSWDKEKREYVEESAEFFEYEGEVAQAQGGSKGGQTTTATTKPWEAQQPYLKDLFGQAQSYAQGAPSDLSASTGVIGNAIDAYTNAAGGVGGYVGAVQGANQDIATGSLLNPSANPAFSQYLDLSNQAIAKQYTEGFLPQLESGAVQAGNVGSSRQGVAQAVGGGKYLDAIQRNTAGLTSAAYGQGLNATLQAQGLAPGLAGASGIAGDLYKAGGSLQYGLDTQGAAQRLERLNAYKALVGGNYGGTTTKTGPGTRTGGISGALGGAAVGAKLGSVVPVLGTGVGAVAGGIAGYFS